MAILLSKSDFKVARTCPTKLFYKKSGYSSLNEQDDYLELLAEGGYMIEKIAKVLHPEGREIEFKGDYQTAAEETMRALDADDVTLFEATLIIGGKLARIDILIKRGMTFKLIEAKAKSYDSVENAQAI